MVGTVDLNATDGNAVDRPHVGHAELRAQPGPASYELSLRPLQSPIRASLQHPGGTDPAGRRPLMLGVGHNHAAIGELDLSLGPLQHGLCRRDHRVG